MKNLNMKGPRLKKLRALATGKKGETVVCGALLSESGRGLLSILRNGVRMKGCRGNY